MFPAIARHQMYVVFVELGNTRVRNPCTGGILARRRQHRDGHQQKNSQ
jgi:hypothetical protein